MTSSPVMLWSLSSLSVTLICTGACMSPAEHQYQPVSFLFGFRRVTVKTPRPSSAIVTAGSCGDGVVGADWHECRSPLSHHFFSVFFSLSPYKQGMLTSTPSSTDTMFSFTDKSGGSETSEVTQWQSLLIWMITKRNDYWTKIITGRSHQ